MADRYDPAENDGCSYAWLSEWLCEYVDGTMDPSVRAVFEEYLAANPALREHVDRLCRTRDLLGQCACREQGKRAAKDLQASLGRYSECDLMQSRVPLVDRATGHAGMFVAVASAMSIMLGVGVFIGAFFFAEPMRSTASSESSASVEAVRERAAAPASPVPAPALTYAPPSSSSLASSARAPSAARHTRFPRTVGVGQPMPLFLADSLRGGRTLAGMHFMP